jgi:hypothetical protein
MGCSAVQSTYVDELFAREKVQYFGLLAELFLKLRTVSNKVEIVFPD